MRRWREGWRGTFAMGLEQSLLHRLLLGVHGFAFCSGGDECFWIAALSILVGLEKMLPGRVLVTFERNRADGVGGVDLARA